MRILSIAIFLALYFCLPALAFAEKRLEIDRPLSEIVADLEKRLDEDPKLVTRPDPITNRVPQSKSIMVFDLIIHSLLQVSPNDTRGIYGLRRFAINMESRKEFFMKDSYADYLVYVAGQKKDILTLGEDFGAPHTCYARLDEDTKSYQPNDAGDIAFSGSGQFSCGAWDAFDLYGKFTLNVSAKKDPNKPHLIIDNWKIDIIEPVRPQVYVKQPCIKDDETTYQDILLRPRIEMQRKHGCI